MKCNLYENWLKWNAKCIKCWAYRNKYSNSNYKSELFLEKNKPCVCPVCGGSWNSGTETEFVRNVGLKFPHSWEFLGKRF